MLDMMSGLKLRLWLLAAATALGSTPASAQPPAAPVETPRWHIDHGQVYCTLGRDYGLGATSFAIRVIPGTTRTELLMTNREWRETPLDNGQPARIVLAPGGDPIEANAVTHRLSGGERVLAFFYLGKDFVDRFDQSSQLRVTRGDRTVATFDFPRPGRAVAMLRDCVNRTLGDWGIDVAAQARLRSPPELISLPLQNTDYPIAALRADAQGVVIVRMTIGTDGRVAECVVVRSSGVSLLDNRTCQEFRREGRYRPAIGNDGQPVSTGVIMQVMWRITDL
jgi:TonB family protein